MERMRLELMSIRLAASLALYLY